MTTHDTAYKQLFSHPRMVEDLLRGYVTEEWVSEIDFSTLERVADSFISDDFREREDDVIWRVRWGERWLYLYLLIEFQSTVDRFMAVRLLTYIGHKRHVPEEDFTEFHELQEIHSMLADRIDSWFQQWERQGMQKGMQKGESRLLLQLIQHRFGHDLPGWVESRLETASSEQLEGWGMALLTANTLAEVFGDPPE
jgi:hypothetical protein